MKRHSQRDNESRFSGPLRHYHRSGARPQRTWDEWVDGDNLKPGSKRKWLKIIAAVLGLLALGAIIAGLVVAMS